MVTRVLSIVRSSEPGAARSADPALDLNTYAVAEDVELTLVLRDRGVELALANVADHRASIAGVEVAAARPADDIAALLASGIRVLAVDRDVTVRGLLASDLVAGTEVVDEAALAGLIASHDVTLTTCTT